MGADFTAQAIIGYKLERSWLYETRVDFDCACTTALPSHHYCPSCGEVRKEQEFPKYSSIEEYPSTVYKNEIYWGTDRKEAYVGYCVKSEDTEVGRGWRADGRKPLPNTELVLLECKELVEKLGQKWERERFGLWAVQHVSY